VPVTSGRGGREGSGRRVGEWRGNGHLSGVAAAARFLFGSQNSAVRLGATAALTNGRLPAQPTALQFHSAVPTAATVEPPPLMSARLAQDRENVRQLSMRHELEGVLTVRENDSTYRCCV